MGLDDGTFTIEARNGAEDSNSNLIDLQYEVKLVKRFPNPGIQNFQGLPSIKPENSFQFNLGGKKESTTLEFIMYDDGTDRSNGTLSNSTISDSRFSNDTVVTPLEQKIWINEYINTFDLSVDWRLYGRGFTDRVNTGEGTPVVLTETRPEPSPDRPNSIRMVVQMNIGNRVI